MKNQALCRYASIYLRNLQYVTIEDTTKNCIVFYLKTKVKTLHFHCSDHVFGSFYFHQLLTI